VLNLKEQKYMKKLALIGLLITGFIVNGFSTELLIDRIQFASINKAKELITQKDDYTRIWSQFDIDSRMHKLNSTKEELLNAISEQPREWTSGEKCKIQNIIQIIAEQITKQDFKIEFPKEIYFVKTTNGGKGEPGAYTRANYIVLSEKYLERSDSKLKIIITHELFHILTRANTKFRQRMYEIIGFRLMNNVNYPEAIKSHRITNPDAVQTDSYIKLEVNGKSVNCMMINYSKSEYDGGSYWKYLNIGFLSLVGNEEKSIELYDNKPVIYTIKQVTGFYEQVGKNTHYIIHPEEILANNFVYAILNKPDLPNPEIVDMLKMKLKNKN
jgi:predicted SprT family Zn-dependent metalloprotease